MEALALSSRDSFFDETLRSIALAVLLAAFGTARANEIECPSDALDGVVASARASVQEIAFSACKTDPNNKDRLFVVIGYKPPAYKEFDDLPYVVGVFHQKSRRTSSYLKSHLVVDATVWIENTHIEIETARYNLAQGVRAFGVRINASHSPRCAEGGSSNELSLFVEYGPKLRRLFGPVDTNYFNIVAGPVCDNGRPGETVVHEWRLVLAIGANKTNGFRDLVLKFKGAGGAKDVECVMSYNGVVYANGCRPSW